MHNGTCAEVKRSKKLCPLHDDYAKIRSDLIRLFRNKTIYDLVKTANDSENILLSELLFVVWC